jgi:hypothetical protein
MLSMNRWLKDRGTGGLGDWETGGHKWYLHFRYPVLAVGSPAQSYDRGKKCIFVDLNQSIKPASLAFFNVNTRKFTLSL